MIFTVQLDDDKLRLIPMSDAIRQLKREFEKPRTTITYFGYTWVRRDNGTWYRPAAYGGEMIEAGAVLDSKLDEILRRRS